MILTLWMTLQVAAGPSSAPLPKPLTDQHIRDIGCVATLGLMADDQRRGIATSRRFPDVTARGRKYAGIVGDRVVFETGQPVAVIGLAIRRAVEERQRLAVAASDQGKDPTDILGGLMADCLPLLNAVIPEQPPAVPGEQTGNVTANPPEPAQ